MSVSQALSRMLDSVTANGLIVPGYTPGLLSRLGQGSFDETSGDRFAHLLDTGCALSRDVSTSWLALQKAAWVGPGEPSAEALLAGPAATLAFNCGGADIQHRLTVEVEDRRTLALEADLARLPAGHPFRGAYDKLITRPAPGCARSPGRAPAWTA